jgi:ribose transport system substrate-binding protein
MVTMSARLGRLLLPLVAVAFWGCQPAAPPEPPGPSGPSPTPKAMPGQPKSAAAEVPSAPSKVIAVVPKAVAHQFWTTIKAGAEDAAAAAGAKVEWNGPDSESNTNAQRAILEDYVTAKVDAIVMAACDAKGMVATAEKAEAAGIPVITIDSGLAWEKVRCLVATDNVAAAKTAGEELIKRIGGKGKVGLIPFLKGAASSEDREQGFKQAVTGNKDVQLVATLYSDSEISKAATVTADMLNGNPDLAGIFAANEPGVVGAANAIKSQGKAGKVVLVGFDGSPTEVDLLKEGVVSALILQDPYKMGFEGVRQALLAITGKPVEKRVDTGVFVLTKDNLDTPDAQRLLNPKAAPAAAPKGEPKAAPK